MVPWFFLWWSCSSSHPTKDCWRLCFAFSLKVCACDCSHTWSPWQIMQSITSYSLPTLFPSTTCTVALSYPRILPGLVLFFDPHTAVDRLQFLSTECPQLRFQPNLVVCVCVCVCVHASVYVFVSASLCVCQCVFPCVCL